MKEYHTHLEELVEQRTAELQKEIEEREQTQKALHRNQRWLTATLKSIEEAVITTNNDGTVTFINPAAERLTGWTNAEAQGKDVGFEIIDKEDISPTVALLRNEIIINVTDNPFLITKNGVKIPVEYSGAPIRDEQNGNVTGAVLVLRDITARKQAEQELRIKDMAIASSLSGIALSDLNGITTYVNQAFLAILGYQQEDVLGKHPIEFVADADREKMLAAFEMVDKLGQWTGELRFRKQDHSSATVNLSANLVKDSENHPVCMMASFVDITEQKHAEEERRQLERQLRQSQKMEAIGTLAGGIAHDFNNILSTMLGYTELLLLRRPEAGKERTFLEEVYRAGERATELIQQILTFSRVESQELRPIRIGPLVKEALKMMRATLPRSIEIQEHLNRTCPPILANATQIHQVLVNLCTNAAYAMQEQGGVLDVSLTEITAENIQYFSPDIQPETPYVQLTITDSGCGMNAEIRERIFDPFFTTKAVGDGTGLGLSVVHGIVKNHQGTIIVESEPGQGSAFHLFFPVVEADPREAPPSMRPGERGEERILLVEDEPALARYYAIALESLGYQVTVFQSGSEALETFRKMPRRFDLVFTDQAMPGMTGLELSQHVLSIQPDLPIILATGYSSTLSQEKVKSFGIRYFLMKPVSISTLTQLIREGCSNPTQQRIEGSSG